MGKPPKAGPAAKPSRRTTGRHNGGMATTGHLPSEIEIREWPTFTLEHPLRLLASACLRGARCGFDGSSYGAPFSHTEDLFQRPNVHVVTFCPEDFAFGTPRAIPDIHGGDGFDVLDGKAKVVSDTGEDWTGSMLDAAYAMLMKAQDGDVRLALLTDISAACGSEIIYWGARSRGQHQAGQGVCAALLIRNGIKVFSQRDGRTLDRILCKLDPSRPSNPDARDHHETEWYVEKFGSVKD